MTTRGRPKVDNPRTAALRSYVMPEVKSRLVEAAQRKKISESDAILEAVLKWMEKEDA